MAYTKINWTNTTPINTNNLNQLQTNVENALNEIVESGNNENGSWVKFADGTMICSGRIAYLDLKINVALKNLYCSTMQQITYSQPFIDIPSCTLDIEQNITANNFVWITKCAPWGSNSKTPGFYATATSEIGGTGTYGFYISYTAVGRWK